LETRGLAAAQKNAARRGSWLILIDETGLFTNPLVRRTWAPKGQTPKLPKDAGRHRKVSAIGALCVSPRGRRPSFRFATLPEGAFNSERTAGFLRKLLRELRGPLTVVWDGAGNHRGQALRDLLRSTRRLTLHRLPPYAPELNPVEPVWSWLKYGQLANYQPPDLAALDGAIVDRLGALAADSGLLRRLWARSELSYPERRKKQLDFPAGQ
jgi:transposase